MREDPIAEKIIDYVLSDIGHWSLDSLAAGLQKEAWVARVNTMLDRYVSEQYQEFLISAGLPTDSVRPSGEDTAPESDPPSNE